MIGPHKKGPVLNEIILATNDNTLLRRYYFESVPTLGFIGESPNYFKTELTFDLPFFSGFY